MELRQYFAVIWKWLWLIALATAVAAGSTYLATRDQAPIYRTKATVMVGQVISDPDPTNVDFYTGQQLARTYADLVKREPVMQATVDALGLTMGWQSLAGRTSVQVVEGTQLLEISVTDTDPTRAQALANEIANQLILESPTSLSEEEQRRQAFLEAQAVDLENKIAAAQAQIGDLEDELADATSARQMQDLRGQITTLQAQIQTWQSTYIQLMALLNDSEINYLSVVEPAVLPAAPLASTARRDIMLAAAIGLVLAVGAAFLIEYLDDTIKTPEDIARATELTTLGGIARIEGNRYPDKLIAVHHPLSPIVEAYRVLRTNLQFSSVDKSLRTLMVTSPAPTEGKSVTLANLAVVMAQSGLRVIIADTDMRRPVQHRIFGLSNSHGVSDAILHPNPGAAEHLLETGVGNLWLLPSGHIPPNPAELLGSGRMAAVIEELKGYADVVLFDAPPTLVVADAVILGSKVDGVLMVTDAGSTRRHAATKAVEELRRVKANLLGVVLNRLSGRRNGYYYYYHYYYDQSEDGKRERRKHRRRRAGWLQRLLPFSGNGAKKPNGAQPDGVEEEIGTQINADTN
jgi:capsular exopolysaccharide synthesis family protein